MGSPLLAFWLYLPLAGIALGGAILLHFALFHDRSRSRRRCPRCWYDMSGAPATPPIRCPECGRVARSERELARTRRRWWLAAVGYALIVPLLLFFTVRDGRRTYYAVMPRWKLVEELRVNNTVARRYTIRDPDDRGGRFVLFSNGAKVMEREDFDIEFGQERLDPSAPADAPLRYGAGDDLNNDGIPDLVVFSFSGGAHCCYTVYVIELASPPRIVASIDAVNGMGLDKVAAHGKTEILLDISDQSFDYWNASHADSPAPSVWYRLEKSRLRIALDQMIAPPESILAAHIPPPQSSGPSSALWSTMLDLLYSGNEKACWDYFDTNWPAVSAGQLTKDAFKKEFLSILNKSPQWRDFQAARAADADGKPIPPAAIGNYKPQSPADPPPPASAP